MNPDVIAPDTQVPLVVARFKELGFDARRGLRNQANAIVVRTNGSATTKQRIHQHAVDYSNGCSVSTTRLAAGIYVVRLFPRGT